MAVLCLGTAQFGLSYGVSNPKGKPSLSDVFKTLRTAASTGIAWLDTAALYGDSEERLGAFFAENGCTFRTVTKIHPESPDQVLSQVSASLTRLRQTSVYGCLFHDYSLFEKDEHFWEHLRNARNCGKISKAGFSLYYPWQLDRLLESNIDLDIVQIPYNLLDRRFEPYFPELARRKIEIHARSPFLQGLFFMEPSTLPSHLTPLAPKLTRLQELASELGLSVSALSLGFVANRKDIHCVVLGVSGVEDLEQNIQALKLTRGLHPELSVLDELREDDENLIVPAKWNLDKKK